MPGTSCSNSPRNPTTDWTPACSTCWTRRRRGLIAEATIAASLDQAAELWALREKISDSQKHFGGSIKHDVSVPVACVPAFLAAVGPEVQAAVPGARLCAFGHLGDGNIHCNVQQPEGGDKAAFLARWDEVNRIVHAIVGRYGGSISAEHGIGQLKRDLLPEVKDPRRPGDHARDQGGPRPSGDPQSRQTPLRLQVP